LSILAVASNLICEKYGIKIDKEEPTYNPIMLSGAPALEYHDHLWLIKYHIHDRLNFAKSYPNQDKSFLGGSETIYEIIDKIYKSEPNSKWVLKVKKLLAD